MGRLLAKIVLGGGTLMLAGAAAAALWLPGARSVLVGRMPTLAALEGGPGAAWTAVHGGLRDMMGLAPLADAPPPTDDGPDVLATMRGAMAAGIAMSVAGTGDFATEEERNEAMLAAAMGAAMQANPDLIRDQMGPDATDEAVALVEAALGEGLAEADEAGVEVEAEPDPSPPVEVKVNRGLP